MVSLYWFFLASLSVLQTMVQCVGWTCLPNRGEVLVRSDHGTNEHSHSKSGHFHSPNWPGNYETDSRCVYRFVAGIGEKVHIQFAYLHLPGEMPRCTEDFLDIYIDVASSSLDIDRENALLSHLASGESHTTTPFSAATYSAVLDRSALLRRFCGALTTYYPRTFVSLHREIVLDFYANTANIHRRTHMYGFNGSFEFISDAAYYTGRALSPTELRLPQSVKTTSACQFRIDSTNKGGGKHEGKFIDLPGESGELISPTFPGFHPDGLFCVYQLVGTKTQRINIDLLEMDLPIQDATCPIDYLMFYDGLSMESSNSILPSSLCGIDRRVRIVSSGSTLVVLFVTGTWSTINSANAGNYATSKRQGFRLRYHFSDGFLPISLKHAMNHIRGTECDYLIRSHGSTEAVFDSPTSSKDRLLLPDRLCTTYFMGTVQRNYMESVRITFDQLELPQPSGSGERCDKGFLAIYGSRDLHSAYQLTEPNYASSKFSLDPLLTPDQIFCSQRQTLDAIRIGADIEEAPIHSRHSFLVLQLNSTGAVLPGMKAEFRLRYRFERGFAIPGMSLHPSKCQFVYSPFPLTVTANGLMSQLITSKPLRHLSGWTNSPFYPLPYPSNSTCSYLFLIGSENSHSNDSTVRLSFGQFELSFDEDFSTEQSTNLNKRTPCIQNFLEIVAIRSILTPSVLNHLASPYTDKVAIHAQNWEHSWRAYWDTVSKELTSLTSLDWTSIEPIALYCGTSVPGPIQSDPGISALMVRFHSGTNEVYKGFTLNYEFIEGNRRRPECGGNISSDLRGGTIESPNYPRPYPDDLDCRWNLLSGAPESVLQLQFDAFFLSDSVKNCSQSVLRIYTGSATDPLVELCGNHTSPTPLMLPGTSVTIRFTTIKNYWKATGFRLIWTIILPLFSDGTCDGFRCEHTKHCISNQLVCDGLPNCGVYEKARLLITDDSDENANCMFTIGTGGITYNFVHISIGVVLTFVLLFALIGIVYYRERRRKRMLMDPLAELTGSRHSLAPSHTSTKSQHQHHHHHHHHGNPRKCNTGHTHMHSRQNSRTHMAVDGNRTSSYVSTYRSSKRHTHNHDRRINRSSTRSNQIPTHNYASRHQLIPIHNIPKQIPHHPSGRHRSKSPCSAPPGRSSTLRRHGSHISGSSRSGIMSHAAASCISQTDNEEGLLMRERMQTISIV